MRSGLDPFSFLAVCVAGWINRRDQQVIEYLIEENRVLREQIGKRRMRFSDNQRCRLAARAKKLSRKALRQARAQILRFVAAATRATGEAIRGSRDQSRQLDSSSFLPRV